MTALVIVLVLAAVALGGWFLFGHRLGGTADRWGDVIAFQPKEELSPERLFQLLLSGTVFAMNADDFNQLGSKHGKAHVSGILAEWWKVDSLATFGDALGRMREALEEPDQDIVNAMQVRREGLPVESEEGEHLAAVERYLQSEQILDESGARPAELKPDAWTIERTAALARWGATVGYLTPEAAWTLLAEMAKRARAAYRTYPDYAVSYLLARGIWGPVDPESPGETWRLAVAAHRALTSDPKSPLLQSAAW